LNFGNLENLYLEIEKDSNEAKKIKPQTREALIKNKNQAIFSKELAKIVKNVSLDFDLSKCTFREFDEEKAKLALEKFGFQSLIKRISEIKEIMKEKKTLELKLY
jgi:DNA polymerase-1